MCHNFCLRCNLILRNPKLNREMNISPVGLEADTAVAYQKSCFLVYNAKQSGRLSKVLFSGT
jgi:hypothetical protein